MRIPIGSDLLGRQRPHNERSRAWPIRPGLFPVRPDYSHAQGGRPGATGAPPPAPPPEAAGTARDAGRPQATADAPDCRRRRSGLARRALNMGRQGIEIAGHCAPTVWSPSDTTLAPAMWRPRMVASAHSTETASGEGNTRRSLRSHTPLPSVAPMITKCTAAVPDQGSRHHQPTLAEVSTNQPSECPLGAAGQPQDSQTSRPCSNTAARRAEQVLGAEPDIQEIRRRTARR